MIFEIIFVVELFTTFWTEMFVVCSLLVNIPQVFDQIFPEKKFLVTDTTRDIKVALGSMLFPHVTIQLAPGGKWIRIEEAMNVIHKNNRTTVHRVSMEDVAVHL